MRRVYLCGPINGCQDAECKDWREIAKAQLPNTVDPMDRDYRGRELESGIAAEIVENDKADIDGCDVLLVYYTRPSVGTSMEIIYAWQQGKQVILVCEPNVRVSPWLAYHSTCVFHSMRKAIDYISTVQDLVTLS